MKSEVLLNRNERNIYPNRATDARGLWLRQHDNEIMRSALTDGHAQKKPRRCGEADAKHAFRLRFFSARSCANARETETEQCERTWNWNRIYADVIQDPIDTVRCTTRVGEGDHGGRAYGCERCSVVIEKQGQVEDSGGIRNGLRQQNGRSGGVLDRERYRLRRAGIK